MHPKMFPILSCNFTLALSSYLVLRSDASATVRGSCGCAEALSIMKSLDIVLPDLSFHFFHRLPTLVANLQPPWLLGDKRQPVMLEGLVLGIIAIYAPQGSETRYTSASVETGKSLLRFTQFSRPDDGVFVLAGLMSLLLLLRNLHCDRQNARLVELQYRDHVSRTAARPFLLLCREF